ncbi:MAG: hypothetical protein IPP28_03150 [Xanthomonadales bacterium]|nr:hypothetical protein [Xanthomonadales bacterium]
MGQQIGFEVEPGEAAAALRAAGRLLGVWSKSQRTYLHPDFQFDGEGRLRPQVAILLATLPSEGDAGGWRRAFWLYSVREALDGRCPADVFPDDPSRVLALASREFGEGNFVTP